MTSGDARRPVLKRPPSLFGAQCGNKAVSPSGIQQKRLSSDALIE